MTSIERLREEARRHEAGGRRGRAIECYEKIIRLRREAGQDPDPSVHLSLGDLYLHTSTEDRALEQYLLAADRYLAAGGVKNAQSLLNLCLRLFPRRPVPHLKLAELFFRLGQTERARSEIRHVARVAREVESPGDEFARQLREYVEGEHNDLFAGRVIEALRDFDAVSSLVSGGEGRVAGVEPVVEEGSGDARAGGELPAWLSDDALGVEKEEETTRELSQGLEVVEEMLEFDPARVDLLERRAAYARRLGDRDRLIETWLDLAAALRRERGSRGARLLYHRVLEVDPENERALAALRPVDRAAIRAASGEGNAEAAATAMNAGMDEGHFERKLLEEFSSEGDPIRWLEAAAETSLAAGSMEKDRPLEFFEFFGRYLMARGRWGDAAAVLEKGITSHQHDTPPEGQAECRFALGLALRQLGRYEEAERQFRWLAEHEPGFRIAFESLPQPVAA